MPHNPAACSTLNPASIAKSYNQVAKWGVSIFGALSAFDSQPKNADSEIKVANEDSKTWQPCQP